MGQRRVGLDPVRVRLGLMAAGMVVVLIGLDRVLWSASFWVGYGVRVWTSGDFDNFLRRSTAAEKVHLARAWAPEFLEPIVGVCIVALGIWLFRSRSAVRMVLGLKRRQT